MALIPKKTYSRRNNELSVLCDKEKENLDPFDVLLSSPLKQDVQFQPLSFWGRKVKQLQSKQKPKKVDCGLFEPSDSDEPNSPCQRKRKPNTNYAESKARTLQPKSRSLKLNGRRKNYSADSCIKKTKFNASVISNTNKTLVTTDGVRKDKAGFIDSDLYLNETVGEKLNSTQKSCDSLKFNNVKKYFKRGRTLANSNLNFNKTFTSVRPKENHKKNLNKFNVTNIINSSNLRFKVHEGISTSEQQLNRAEDETVIPNCRGDSVNSVFYDSKNMDETLTPFHLGHYSFKFVNTRRHFKYPNCFNMSHENFDDSCNSIEENNSDSSLIQLQNKPKKCIGPINGKFENFSNQEKFLEKINDETLNHYDDSSINSSNTLFYNESLNKTLCVGNFSSEESNEISRLECEGENTVSGDFEFMSLNDSELEDLSKELQIVNGVLSKSSSTSDDTLSSFNDEDTVINVKLKAEANDSPLTGSHVGRTDTQSVLNGVSVLTTRILDLSISNATDSELSDLEIKKISYQRDSNFESLRNITTRRRPQNSGLEKNFFNGLPCTSPTEHQIEKDALGETEFEETLWRQARTSLDWNKSICFANPVFESTRVLDVNLPDVKKQTHPFENSGSILEKTLAGFDRTCTLKPGKKWQRSMSVLKQIQNGSITEGRLESTRITGRKFDSFVRDMLEIKNDSENSSQDKSEKFVIDHSVFSKTLQTETLSERSSLNHTVKVVQPEETPSAFRSALGLDTDRSLLREDSVQEKSSSISAKDFILLQCHQEDVLPFEKYFNERTLENCRKIGEGVYGEVFMCTNSVIKIIPIEGSDKVNGEPQKTFEEIISEVVIASKLSNLRKGEKHRTDGFSEMKRCWCVKGKYPKYLLKLWDEYDQLGSGSENDSPVMFKGDQLYIILELANGGKDLESFVFNSSAQSLSVFIQTAFSLAVAEKAYEFEHRDLHWGNILISETKDRFMSVLLDGVEHKIPTKGVKVCIIDFTLSRISHEGCCIFNDLSVDPSLFASEGDYQFEIYRLMLREVQNDWSLFRPKTNIFWLHYTLDKILKMVRYKNKKAKIHMKHLRDVKILECLVLDHKDSSDFVLSDSLNVVIKKL